MLVDIIHSFEPPIALSISGLTRYIANYAKKNDKRYWRCNIVVGRVKKCYIGRYIQYLEVV